MLPQPRRDSFWAVKRPSTHALINHGALPVGLNCILHAVTCSAFCSSMGIGGGICMRGEVVAGHMCPFQAMPSAAV